MSAILVFIGGGLGSLARYALGLIFPYKEGFPFATFCANICAAFVLGIALGWLSKEDAGSGSNIKWFLATGFCGGFSTFSTFSAETVQLIKNQQWSMAGIYVILSLFLSLLILALGFYLGGRTLSNL
jgi:CrcB protein